MPESFTGVTLGTEEKPGPKLKAFCPPSCSLNERRIGSEAAEMLADLRAKGYGAHRFGRVAANVVGKTLGNATLTAHFRHYREAAPEETVTAEDKPSDIQILDSIVAAGFRNSKNWRPTIKDTMEAMKLKMQLTGNSAFEDMLDAMAAAGDLEEEEVMSDENPEALGSDSERQQGAADDEQ